MWGSNNLLSPPNPRHIVTAQMSEAQADNGGHEEIPMGPMDPQDHGMLYATRLVNTFLILRVLVIDVNLKELHDTSKSGPLFSLYSKMVEEDDIKRAERQQKDAEGIVLFVSPHSYLLTPEQVNL